MKLLYSAIFLICLSSISLFADSIEGKYYLYTIKSGNLPADIIRIFNISKKELQDANNIKIFSQWFAGKVIKIPVYKSRIFKYKIQNGDSLYSIAKQYNIPVKDLQITIDNKIQKNMWVGSYLYLPTIFKQKQVTDKIKEEEPTQTEIIEEHSVQEKTMQETPLEQQEKKLPDYTFYTVKKGDTYYGLSNKAGLTVKEIQDYNNNKPLMAGLKIKIPSTSSNTIIETKKQPTNKETQKKSLEEKSVLLNTQIPFKGKLTPVYQGKMDNYSPLVSGVTYTITKQAGKSISAPMPAVLDDIKPIIGFGMGMFLTHGNTTVILASKGFYNFLHKKQAVISAKDPIAYVSEGYKVYLFMIKDGKIVPPF